MFIKNSFVNEIAREMEDKLVSNAEESLNNEDTKELAKTAVALNHLVKAAELFEDLEMVKEAEVATALLEVIAKKKKKRGRPSKKSKSPKKSKAPSSAKQVENLKEKGWVFDQSADDVANAADAILNVTDGLGRVGPTQMAADEPTEDELAKEFDKIMQELESEQSEPMGMAAPEEHPLEKDFEEEK